MARRSLDLCQVEVDTVDNARARKRCGALARALSQGVATLKIAKTGKVVQSTRVHGFRDRVTCARCMLSIPRTFGFAGAGEYLGRYLCRHCYMQVIRG